jgi:hypothetical protein
MHAAAAACALNQPGVQQQHLFKSDTPHALKRGGFF